MTKQSKHTARPRGHGGMMMGLDKPKNFKKTFKRLLTYLNPHRLSLFFVLIAAIFGTVFNVIGPKVMGNTITVIFDGAYAKLQGISGVAIDFAMVGKLLLLLASLYLFASFFQFIQQFIMASVAQKTVYQLREDRSEEHTSELQSRGHLVCRLLLEKKKD